MPQLGTGGAESQLLQLIEGSSSCGIEHVVVTYSPPKDTQMVDRYRRAGIAIREVRRNARRPVDFVWRLSRVIDREDPDVVHCWLVSGNFWGRWAALLARRRPILLAWRNCDVWNAKGMWVAERFTSRWVHHLANSGACARYVGRSIGVPTARFDVVYNGLDASRYAVPYRVRAERWLADGRGETVVTMVARLEPQKNHGMLLRVASRAKRSGLPLRFRVVGAGGQEQQLRWQAVAEGVADIVSFEGVRDDIPAVLSETDVFLFTSNFEGFPNAVLEAMAAGLPVVSTDFEGVSELIKSPDRGLVIPRDDDRGAEAALRGLLAAPRDALKMGAQAAEFVTARFSVEAMVGRTVELYRRLVVR
jgi:glycosyltransferase involved in cell wall biosynthesis